jgi:signal transduction histidine kinase
VAFVDTVRQHGKGFVDYQWPKPGSDKPVDKVSYVQGFEPWGWVIGSGIYVDDLHSRSGTTCPARWPSVWARRAGAAGGPTCS